MSELSDVWFVVLHTQELNSRVVSVRNGHTGYVRTDYAPTREEAVGKFMEFLPDVEDVVSAMTGRISDCETTPLP